jgi:lipopolysaccharide/colanic/teichoic acid biosynthesis glycosyltransferase
MQNGEREVQIVPEQEVEAPARAGVCSPETFRALLRHERARADRDGSEFSLAVFDTAGNPSLTRRIRRLLRSIDEVGWIDARTLGVLLPSTPRAGGEAFSRRVLDRLDGSDGTPSWRVYSYPHHWLLTAGQRAGDAPGQRAAPAGSGSPVPAASEFRAAMPSVLERVFSRPIPAWKGVLDVGGALFMILFFSPLFLLVPLYIKVVSPGPVFFRHQRVGLRGRTFTFLKFRTMRYGNNEGSHKEHIVAAIRAGRALEKLDDKGDDRIIPGGRILRKTCVDELPQVFNVLRREMSLVGPRPCMPYEADEFLRWHTHRFDVLPGMTGLWQVSGKNKLTFSEMIRLDISYAKSMSFWKDAGILLRTFPAIWKMTLESVAKHLAEGRGTRIHGTGETEAAAGR